MSDLIDRDYMLTQIEKAKDENRPFDYDSLIDFVKVLPNANKIALEKQKTGHWIEQDGYDGDTYYDCSECGESFCLIEGTPTDNLYNYCPNCGAKMEGE